MDIKRIYNYKYNHLNSFSKNPTDHHRSNLNGEIFENYCIEMLLEKYEKRNDVRVISKGPYLGKNNKKNGFGYNKNGDIYYFSESETIAEFDFIAIKPDIIELYEISNSKNINQIISLDEIKRKRNLFKIAFHKDTYISLITSKKIVKPRYVDAIENIDFPNILIDLEKIQSKKLTNNKIKFISIIDIEEYDYYNHFKVVKQLYKKYLRDMDINKYYQTISEKYSGLVGKMYIGNKKDKIYFVSINNDKCIFSLRCIVQIKNEFFEYDGTRNVKIKSSKRVIKEINKIKDELIEIKNWNVLLENLKGLSFTHNKELELNCLCHNSCYPQE